MQEYLDRSSAAPLPRTLIDILRETAARHPQASALEDDEGALSYAELLAQAGQTAARLHAHGVRRGDRIGVRMPSGTRDLYIAILGIMMAGAAYVPVDADDPVERAHLVFGEAAVRGSSQAPECSSRPRKPSLWDLPSTCSTGMRRIRTRG